MNTKDKDSFREELREVEKHYRSLGTEEPPAMLDQAVLNRARRAAEQHSERPWSFGWMHATASVALVVLGLAVVMQVRENSEPGPALPADQAQGQEQPDSRPDPEQDTVEDFRQRETEAIRASHAQQKSELMDELREENLRRAAPVAQEPKAQAPRPPATAPSKDTMGPAFATPGSSAGTNEAANREAQEEAVADADALNSVVAEALPFENAQDWLAHIISLKKDGLEEAWTSELAAFVEAYPGYPLPDDLAAAVESGPGDQ